MDYAFLAQAMTSELCQQVLQDASQEMAITNSRQQNYASNVQMDAPCANHLFCVFFVQNGSLCYQTIPVHLSVPIAIILTAAPIYARDSL